MVSIDIIMDPIDMNAYRQAWDNLFSSAAYEPSTSYEWTNALKLNHTKLFSKFFLIKLEKNNQITGLIPMIAKEEKLFGKALVTISPISELYNTHSDFLINECSEEIICAVMESLAKLPFRWDLFRLTRILDENQLLNSFDKALSKIPFHYRTQYEPPSFHLALDDSLEKYLSKRSGKFRNYLKRMQKKLAAHGELQFIKIENEQNFEEIFGSLIEIEQKSWKHDHGTAISAVERQTGFYRDLCFEAIKSKRLHLLFLFLNNIPIAYDMGFIHGNQYSYLKTSFDNQFKPFSPATILRAKLIELLIDDGIRQFDFPGEPYTWEKQWTDDVRWHKSFVVFNKTLMAKTYRFLTTVKGYMKDQKTIKHIDFCDPRDLGSPRN